MSSKLFYFATFFVIILSVERTHGSTSLYDPFETSRVALDLDFGQIGQALTWGAVLVVAVFTGISLFSCFSHQMTTKRKYITDDYEEDTKAVETTSSKNGTTDVKEVKDKEGKTRRRRTLPGMDMTTVNGIFKALKEKKAEYGF